MGITSSVYTGRFEFRQHFQGLSYRFILADISSAS